MSAHAELDENGIEPKHWYKFDGNLDSSGSTALSIEGENGSSYVDSGKGGQAYLFKSDGPCQPYGSGIKRGNGDFTVVTVAKSCDRNHGMIWTQGGKSTGRGFGLVSVGASQVALRVFGSTWSSSGTDLIVADVPDATTAYHVYTLIYTDANRTFTLYVDDATVPAGSGQVSDSASEGTFPDTHFQWGSLFQGLNYSMTQGYGACLDDFRLYQQTLTTAQIKNIVASFRDLPLVWGTAGKAGDGVSTKNDGAFQRNSWTFNFSKDDGIVHDDIDLTKRVSVIKIRMMQRQTKAGKPTAATLTQGANTMKATSVTSYDDETGMTLYNSSGMAAKTWAYHEFIFPGDVDFDPTQDITLSFGGNVGCWVTQPANSVMGNGTWSPVIEITAIHPSDAADYMATIDANTTFTGITSWKPSRPTTFKSSDVLEIDNTAPVTLTMNEAITVKKLKIVNAEGSALTLDMQVVPTVATYDFSKALGGVILDASGVDGRELAMKTVYGAPYSYWLLKGTVRGGEHITVTPPTMPQGYEATTVIDDWGVRVVVTAPRAAKFGSVNINFAGGRGGAASVDDSKVGTLTTEIGGHPVVGTSWNDLGAANQTDTTVAKYVTTDGTTVTSADIKLTASQVANPYTSGAAKNMLITGYIDDGQSPIVQISKIPFSKYRVILYRATDTGNTTFSAAQIGTTSSNAQIYYGPAKSNTDVKYTVQGSAEKDWGKSDKRDGYYEGVNYIVSDVLEGTAGSATAYVYSHKHAGRAGVAAIQIVEVGHIFEGSSEFKATISAAGTYNLTDLDWTPKPFAPTAEKDVKITIDPSVFGEVTVTVDKAGLVMNAFKTVSTGSAAVAVTGNALGASIIDDTASTGAVTIGVDPGAAEVRAGANTILNTVGTGHITIAEGKKLTVTGGTLTPSQVSNGGTLNFQGGTEEDPIYIDGGVAAGMGKITLAENTYVKQDEKGTATKYDITGSGATSFFTIARNGAGAPGMVSGSRFDNVVVESVASPGSLWFERTTATDTVGLKLTGNICIQEFTPNPMIVRSLAGSGNLTRYGNSWNLSIKCLEDADFSGTAGFGLTILEGDGVQTFSGNYTQTLTVNEGAEVRLTGRADPSIAVAGTVYVDPNGAAMTLTRAIAGAGDIIVHDYSESANGSVAFSGDLTGFTGTITYENGSYDIGSMRVYSLPSYIKLESGVSIAATQTAAEYAQGVACVFTGFTPGSAITLRKLDGSREVLTVDAEGKATSTASGVVHIDGPATYADATFTNATSYTQGQAILGTLSYKSIDTLGLQYDSAVTTNAAGTGVYLRHHPYITNLPDSFMQQGGVTIAVVGEMSASNNTIFVHMGSTTQGDKTGLFLASGDKEDEVVVKVNTNGATLTDVTTMNVPQAATARHVYIITKMDTDTQSIFSVYLDGKLWTTVPLDRMIFPAAVQCGADHGGEIRTGTYTDVKSDDMTALINVLRIYDRVISADEIAMYRQEYPYISLSGASSRTFEDTGAFWTEPVGAKCWEFQKAAKSVMTNEAVAASSVEIDGTAGVETTVSVNLKTDVNYETVTISGPGSFAFVKTPGNVGKIVSGETTIGCPVAIEFGTLDVSGAPLSLEDGGSIAFDLSSIDVGSYWNDTVIQVTGITKESDRITQTGLGSAAGRKATFEYNGSQYVVTIKVAGDLTANINGTKDFSDLTWTIGGETIVSVPWASVPKVYINVMGDSQLTFTEDFDYANVMLFVTNASPIALQKQDGVMVNAKGWDFQQLDAKATFAFDPEAAVSGGYVRFDLDMGEKNVATIMAANQGTYEFKRVTLVGLDGQGGRMVRVPEGDEVTLKNAGYADARSSVSLDVCGGTVYMAPAANAAVWYGDDTTRFNLSAGMVYAQATGQQQAGSASGFLIGWSGSPVEFNVSGGLLDVSGSSINFWTEGVTNNITGGKVQAKGIFKGKNPGVINLSDVGVLEIGSLGATADACTLNLDGGILRGYEAGAAFNSPVVQEGATTVSSTEGASLTMGGTFTGSDIVAIPEGTVKLGRDSGLGTGALTVADGATLDVNGCKPGNAIMISGTGADGAGALANTGGDVGFAGTLTFAGDARIGGTAKIGYNQGSTINLGGHTLTIAGRGTGATLALGGMTVQGGGAILVGEKGVLASNGATALGDECDLTIGEKGTLDLSAGNHISCRNFTNAGTITGNQAGIIVNGTLDASAATTLPKLTLHDNATLKGGADGIQLTLTTTGLTLGKTLNVTVEKVTQNIRLATVPTDTPIKPEATALVVNGVSGKYTLELNGTSLLASTGGGNYADVALSSVLGWTNFESLKVDGSLENMRVITAGQTNIDVIVAYESGIATTQRFVYAGGPDGKFSYVVDGVRPGERYGVSAYVLIDSVSISVDSTTVNAMTARTLGAWIDEDYQTFGGQRIGTGSWRDDGKIASVKGETIAFAAATRDQLLSFTSTNRSQIAERGARKDILISETFTAAAYGVGEEGPALPSSAGLVAVAMTTNAQGECQFAVATNGAWQAIGREVFAPSFDKPYEIVVRIDATAETVAYGVVQGKSIVWLVTEVPYTPASESSAVVQIVFTGSGAIAKIDGQCYDANLMQVTIDKTTREYATFEEALAAAGADNAITPLWWSNYEVSGERGAFCVVNNGYFEPLFAKWYRYEKTPGPVQDSYRYVAANNWIEYADESGVEKEANGTYRVMTEPGLAWIAEQATNGVFEGAVTLGADLDLASRNWTPIANFTGSFDGRGFTIEGLNNTNVVIDPLLGEAGYCYGGIRNDEGYEAYGLVAFAQDAEIKNVVLSDLAISNTADSVAALVGVHVGGDLTVENVTNESGVVWGEGRATAGLVTIGGEGEPIGNVVVNGNVNRAEIVGAENAAQILAGTSADTKFTGTVEVAGNVGNGSDMPICNFAAAQNYDDGVYYWTYVEANNKGSVPIDPVNKTARMLAGYFYNGTINYMGQLTDLITASEDGAEIVVPNTTTNDCWDPIVVDRNITLDLNGTCIYGVYDCDLFTVTNGAKLIIGNGELVKVEGYEYYRVATGSSVEETQPLAKGENAGSFYDRTVGVKTFGVVADRATIVIPYTSPDFTYTVQHVNTLAEAWQDVEEHTDIPGTGGEMTFELDASGGSGFYRVKMVPVFW